ncbi:RNA methyltransferase [Brevibacterium sp. 50QC2O2]|uniref:RsmB/NOP family class I SAM-dependent RNA methyltransferase n=1 Tax=Brevibacterium TaxID=1696 RepID=UPI00211CD16C|nr:MULTISPECIES: transcription antitermination factor NusB [unclassified Brevibacterium]MCQ9384025.1 RNA methyltransferase [Brevibacterium sp. 68QC2CO]MCQ9389121.1 RNA methyltransferase [Brevibacterium sp. 50QC2O2]
MNNRNHTTALRGGGTTRRTAVADARTVAWDVLIEVEKEDAYANLLLPRRLKHARLSPADAALATELTYGTLRGQGFYDAVIESAAGRTMSSMEPVVRTALRLGAHQILSMRIADHAAVGETVAIVKRRLPRATGIVNAVLRRVSERTREDWLTLVSTSLDEMGRLALEYSHPAWIVRALRQALHAHGRDRAELAELLAADNAPAAVDLVALPGLADRAELARRVGTPTRLSPLGVELSHGNPLDVPEVAEGTARVQDEGSQLVALALLAAPAPADTAGASWYDMCAGPGGKTSVIGSRAAELGRVVVASDASKHRAELVRDSTRALRGTVKTVNADGREFARKHPGEFARVLVDAPCTGLGALRRRPEARWRRRPADIAGLGPLQRELLEAAWEATAVGGVVAYSTCSPHAAETTVVLEDALRVLPGARLLDAADVLARVTGAAAGEFASASLAGGRAAQLWPHLHGTDGMFLALIAKDA